MQNLGVPGVCGGGRRVPSLGVPGACGGGRFRVWGFREPVVGTGTESTKLKPLQFSESSTQNCTQLQPEGPSDSNHLALAGPLCQSVAPSPSEARMALHWESTSKDRKIAQAGETEGLSITSQMPT